MIRKLAAVIVLVMLTSLSVTGCATLVTQNHDSKLEGYVTEYHAWLAEGNNWNQGAVVFSQWEENWINDTAVNVSYREFYNMTSAYDLLQTNATLERFPTIADTSAYVKSTCNGLNQSSVNVSDSLQSYIYNRSMGHFPSVFLDYNNVVNGTDHPHNYGVVQLDDIVIYSAVTSLPLDYSSYYYRLWESNGMIVERPFSESTSVRGGNDVYMGVVQNATQPGAASFSTVEELTKSQNESKQLYDQYVASRLSEGFTLRLDWVASFNASTLPGYGYNEVWSGQNGANWFIVMYRYFTPIQSWEVTTETS